MGFSSRQAVPVYTGAMLAIPKWDEKTRATMGENCVLPDYMLYFCTIYELKSLEHVFLMVDITEKDANSHYRWFG